VLKELAVALSLVICITLAFWVLPGEAFQAAKLPDTPIVWKDNDDAPIPEPELDEEGDYIFWDGVNAMVFRQLETCLDLGFAGRKVGTWVGLAGPEEAENVNAVDEVPDSTWFTNRHAIRRMSPEELKQGSNLTGACDTEAELRVISGKSIGLSPGFLVEDRKGDRFVIKFDPPAFPEMATATEVIASKFMYAAGYNVPEYYIIELDPERLVLKEGAKITGKYRKKRLMTAEDLDQVFAKAARNPDGTYRAVASKLLSGQVKGPPPTTGVRKDDPNDTVFHQNRRELRGLRVISSFINNTDSRRGNYLDTYVGEDPQGHMAHYMLDFSASMGSGNIMHKEPKYGNEYLVDPKMILGSLVTLGFWVKPWEDAGPAAYDSVGFFEAEMYNPKRWRTTFPNPMFQRMTNRDAFWMAKIVTSFTDEDIRAIVETGQWSDPAATDYVTKVFVDRRDKIGRCWFDVKRINPLDRLEVWEGGQGTEAWVRWRDVAVARGLSDAPSTRYRYQVRAQIRGREVKGLTKKWQVVSSPAISLGEALSVAASQREAVSVLVTIQTSRNEGKAWSPPLEVYLYREPAGKGTLLLGLDRRSG